MAGSADIISEVVTKVEVQTSDEASVTVTALSNELDVMPAKEIDITQR